ncbi:MAG: hypothetical protein JXB17_11415 [Bacteroidales bacterium]|nr:hypothetical protein [Bacteroidales bacterium]
MKKLLLIGLVALFTASLIAQEPEAKTVESKSGTIEKSRGEDPNIVSERPTTDEPAPQPDEATRGSYCKVIVDNWTGYAIDVYVDGEYAGTVGSWSDGYTWAIEGKTKLYGRSTGGTLTWGPVYVDCYYSHTWKLTQ